MDGRLKRATDKSRESRAQEDSSRMAPEDSFASTQERRRMFRSEFTQEALPTPPEIPGFHLCWLSTTNQYDPIHKKLRLGYIPVKAEELPGFENFKVKAGEHTGFVACNEMLLYKLPMDVYQQAMQDLHHYAPLEEQEKIKSQQDQLLNTRDRNGRRLGSIEGDGTDFDQTVRAPVFE